MSISVIRERAGCLMVGVAYPLMLILGLAIHVWTIVIAFATAGLFAAMLTLAFPVIAQLYWGFRIWHATGILVNAYTLALAVYAALWGIIIVGAHMGESE